MHTYIRFLCISLFCFVQIGIAQQVDSLQKKSYQELKKQYTTLEYTNPALAQQYAIALLKKAKQEGNLQEKNAAYLLNASSENYFGNMKASLAYIDSCITYANTQKNDALLIKAISHKGKTYFTFGKYNDAITYYLQLDSLARKTQNIRYQIYSNHSIGSIKNIMGDHKGATELFLKNKEIITPIMEARNYHTLYLNMLIGLISAYTYFDVDAAAAYLPELKKVSLQINDKDALSYYFSLKGIVNYKRKEYDEALVTLAKADSLVSELGIQRNLYPIYRFRGKTYYEKKMFPEAIAAFEAIKTLQKEIEFDDFQYREVLSLLANSYEQIDNTEKALENYRLAHKYSYTDTIQEAIRYTILKEYDKKTLESKIETLKIKSNEKTKQNISLWFISSGLLVSLVILFLIFKKQQRDNRQKFDALLQKLASEDTQKEPEDSNSKFQISNEKITKILEGLEKFEASNTFLQQNTSLVTVAKKLNTNTTYLSQIVNEQKGMTFKNYITELRINYVLRKLKNDKVMRSYTIKAIAKELGFKSEGAFSRAFKKQTGIYPSFFIKNLTAIS
ncbi:AraC-like DNA-binding protein [Kordia periserrulae]|uniref:AraC-like DNA-binding protein n=1 Tax=Kordia periserrulae TaxID=701523 RepID=A0A2T6BVD0_9FLAO|nr:helix-turn-helix domain-containing protein [Kordia periserrulae]PTX60012.1 AraC-like DNA-binding protein [Kordia periserrulae]